MASVNKVIIVGNLGRDPDTRYSPDGACICNISIATTRHYKDGRGGSVEETEWHSVVLYNRLGEIAGEYLAKGRPVYIEGRLKTRKWQDKQTGHDRYKTEIVAEQMQMLGAGPSENTHSPARGRSRAQNTSAAPAQPSAPPSGGALSDPDPDIPFRAHGAGRAWSCI